MYLGLQFQGSPAPPRFVAWQPELGRSGSDDDTSFLRGFGRDKHAPTSSFTQRDALLESTRWRRSRCRRSIGIPSYCTPRNPWQVRGSMADSRQLGTATGSSSPSPLSWSVQPVALRTSPIPWLTHILGPHRHSPPLRDRPHGLGPQEARPKDDARAALPAPRHQRARQLPRPLEALLHRPPRRPDYGLRVGRLPQGPREPRPAAAEPHERPQRHGGHDGHDEGPDGHDHPQHADHGLDQCLFQWLCD